MLSNLISGLGLPNQPILESWLNMIMKGFEAWRLRNYSSFIEQTYIEGTLCVSHYSFTWDPPVNNKIIKVPGLLGFIF